MRLRPALALLVACAPLAGCVSLGLDLNGGWGGGAHGLSTSTRDRDAASDVVYLTNGERIELVLLVEGSASGGVGGGNPPGGSILVPGGRVVNWTCPGRFGKLREFRIDGTAFPLESGRVFHVDVRDGRVLVRQLDLDPHELASGSGAVRENVRANAATHPAVAEFFARCEPSK